MFGGEFRQPLAALDRCTLNKGAFVFKIVRGALKWPLKGGSRLIEVAATAGLTVHHFWKILLIFNWKGSIFGPRFGLGKSLTLMLGFSDR